MRCFPAMEMRRAFPDGDLNYLANLCHGCGACYYDCQFSPPHEFNVNVPQSAGASCVPNPTRPMPGRVPAPDCSRATVWPSRSIAALSVAVFILGFVAVAGRQSAVQRAGRPRRVLSRDAAQRDGGAVRRCFLSMRSSRSFMSVRAFWRDIGESTETPAPTAFGDLWQAMKRCRPAALSRWRRRRLLSTTRSGRPTSGASIIISPSTASCSASRRPAWRRFIIICSAARRRIRWYDLPVVLGTLGGIGLVIGPIGLFVAKRSARSDMVDRGAHRAWTSRSSPCCSSPASPASLLLALRDTPRWACCLRVHLGVVFALFITHALRQVRARPLSFRRVDALRA